MQRYVAVSIRSGRIVYVAPWSFLTPRMVISPDPGAPDICARCAEKPDQVCDFRLSRCAVKRDGPVHKRAGQKQIFRRANAWDRQKNISIPPLAPRGLQNPLLKAKPCAELCERLYMQIDRPLSQRAPPGSASSALPHLARSAPRNRIDERIFPASRFSTRNRDSPEGSMQSVLPSRRVLQPRLSRIASAVRTSSMSGQLCNTHGEVHRQHAARTGSTLFLRRVSRTVPERRAPPVIRSFFHPHSSAFRVISPHPMRRKPLS